MCATFNGKLSNTGCKYWRRAAVPLKTSWPHFILKTEMILTIQLKFTNMWTPEQLLLRIWTIKAAPGSAGTLQNISSYTILMKFSWRTSRNEVVNQESRSAAVLGCEQFAVRRRVREGDFFLGEVTAVHEGVPENRNGEGKMSLKGGTILPPTLGKWHHASDAHSCFPVI